MSKGSLKFLGIVGGFSVILLAGSQFMRSYQAGEAKWNYLLLVSGMALLLFYTIFKKAFPSKKKNVEEKKNEEGG